MLVFRCNGQFIEISLRTRASPNVLYISRVSRVARHPAIEKGIILHFLMEGFHRGSRWKICFGKSAERGARAAYPAPGGAGWGGAEAGRSPFTELCVVRCEDRPNFKSPAEEGGGPPRPARQCLAQPRPALPSASRLTTWTPLPDGYRQRNGADASFSHTDRRAWPASPLRVRAC